MRGLGTSHPNETLSFIQARECNMPDQRDQQKHKGGQGDQQQAHTATDQISFYDESLKKQIEGSYTSDGKSIHVSSAYGVKSAPYGDLGASIDHDSQVLLAQKLFERIGG
jgi:hypothetical protein